MKRDSFVFYRSFFESIEKLKKNDKLTLYSHLCRYALGEEVEDLEGVPAAIFNLIKPQIDANSRRYENGLKGGRPVTKTKPNDNQTETKPKRNVNVNVNDNDNENVNVNVNANVNGDGSGSSGSSDAPTFKEVADEVAEQGYKVSAVKFYDHYEKNHWLTKEGDPVRNWRTMLKVWDLKEKGETPAALATKKKSRNRWNDFDQRDYSGTDLEAQVLNLQEYYKSEKEANNG